MAYITMDFDKDHLPVLCLTAGKINRMTTKNMVVWLIFQLIAVCRQSGWNLLLKKAGLRRHLSRLFSSIFPWFGMVNRGIGYGMVSAWVGYVKTPLTNGIIYLKREECNWRSEEHTSE